jgi:outer membrane immunogenic protein
LTGVSIALLDSETDVFKRSLLTTASLVLLASTALAADLPSRRSVPEAPLVPVFAWTGFYVGGNAGYIFSNDSQITTFGNNGPAAGPSTIFNVNSGARPGSVQLDPEGFTGGGQIGYNMQIGRFVFGLEADAAYTDYKKSVGVIGATGAQSNFSTDLSYLGTVRGRVGIAMDRVLVYGTGGFAYGDVEHSAAFFATPAAGGTNVVQFAGSRSETATGYAAGGGIEYALPTSFSLFGSNAVTLKAEALYYDLGRRNVVVADTGAAPAATRGQSYTSQFETSGVIARAGINFKFGTF